MAIEINDEVLKQKIDTYKTGNYNFQERRHADWLENYQLFRDKVETNRLTQRQSFNVPLMKETVKTIVAKIDDAPDIKFEDKSNDKQKEIYINAYWKEFYKESSLEIKDIVDKKQVALYGRSWKKLNIKEGKLFLEIIDPIDILIDRFVDPSDIETAEIITHTHIYKPLATVIANKNYDKEVIESLKLFYATKAGLLKSEENMQMVSDRNDKLRAMGDIDVDNPIVGEVIVELNENFIKLYDEETGVAKIYVVTTCGRDILMKKPLEDILRVNFFPLESWADDVERTDFYSDGVADVVRTINKVANSWVSQLVENRTLRNFGMHYYDSTNADFVPETFKPVPWGWYPVNGKPSDVIQKVDIPELSESLDEISFVIGLAEKATAVTPTEKGVGSASKKTLGEIELMASNTNERIGASSKFYKASWRKLADKWCQLLLANTDKLDPVTLHKKSPRGEYYEKTIDPSSLKSKGGYKVIVTSSAEQERANFETVKKFEAVKAQMPNNQALDGIYKKKLLTLLDITPEEEQEVMAMYEGAQGQEVVQDPSLAGQQPAPQPTASVTQMLAPATQ